MTDSKEEDSCLNIVVVLVELIDTSRIPGLKLVMAKLQVLSDKRYMMNEGREMCPRKKVMGTIQRSQI